MSLRHFEHLTKAVLSKVVGKCSQHEVHACTHAFLAFMCVLSSYYMLVPLRDEVGIMLGLSALPRLFILSLIVTMLMAPLTTYFIVGSNTRGQGHQSLFMSLASVLIVFYFAILLTSTRGSSRHFGHVGSPGPPMGQRDGQMHLSGIQRYIYASFYIWLGVQNQASISSLWALCADLLDAESGTRLFGFIGSGATLGQLLGSLAVVFVSQQNTNNKGLASPSGPPTQLLLLAASLLIVAAWILRMLSLCTMSPLPHAPKPPELSSLPAKLDIDDRTAQSEVQSHTVHTGEVSLHVSQATALVKLQHQHTVGLTPQALSCGTRHGSTQICDASCSEKTASETTDLRMLKSVGRFSIMNHLTSSSREYIMGASDCAWLIAKSPYLVALCSYMMLQCCTAAMVYFERAMVVSSSMKTASARTSFFGMINLITAVSIFSVQLMATGRIIKRLGVKLALCVSPAVAILGMLLIAIWPSASLVAGVEMVRKVVGHALTKPTREILFTVVTRQEKYKAKIFIDMVLVRMGDTVAAALFEALDVQLKLGPGALAYVGCLLCGCWLVIARYLGGLYQTKTQTRCQTAVLLPVLLPIR